MRTEDEILSFGATRMYIGLSAPVKISPTKYEASCLVQRIAGGSLEVVGSSSSVAGTGYLLGSSEILQFDGNPIMYLVATGSTVTVGLLLGLTDAGVGN